MSTAISWSLIVFLSWIRTAICMDDSEMKKLEHQLSDTTYYRLQNDTNSHDYKPFKLEDLEAEFRNISEKPGLRYHGHVQTGDMNHQTCYFLHMTFRAALVDFRTYYALRQLYLDNKEYEIGYLTHEIISRYQTMLEVFHFAIEKFEKNQNRNQAPPTVMFYYYTNVLEQSKVIIHLCNMLHELERKYSSKRNVLFDDYNLESNAKKRNGSSSSQKALEEYLQKKADERKRKQKRLKKKRQHPQYLFESTTRRVVKSFWPLHYGWSIEYW
ncbi:uncharacterized protein LOC131849050 [Achroia grisella]|uniref:uncharacterized protein LOC131849050 n=1 Tax=Achroia grisella TaxID=688607 RepID=UPI0027D2930A|nr:uncharacterized protein LOC131849050 [Achroia grisella]